VPRRWRVSTRTSPANPPTPSRSLSLIEREERLLAA
jgi:hypothetical protein